jgi:dTDP-4-dehydrorhamnose reductase
LILLLGASGYVGQEFSRYFEQSDVDYLGLSRQQVDYYSPRELANAIDETHADFLINCAGYTGKPNVDACEDDRAACLMANAVLPGLISEACALAGIPWGHVSSGCIYTGTKPLGAGFNELDPPNFSFRQNNCSFYSGSKALGEECLAQDNQCFIWRLRIPFNQVDSSRNYLSKLMRYDCLLDARNSLSYLDEFVAACYDCWQKRIDFGTYNLTNTGSVTAREVVSMIQAHGVSQKDYRFFDDEEQFMRVAARTPRSNTVLDNSKALSAGLNLSHVCDAVDRALSNWTVPQVA